MVVIKSLGYQEYGPIWEQLKLFTQSRSAQTIDELWVLEHHPVFTQGQAGKPEHILNPGNIPIVQSDRGGQVTYHGRGQLIIYFLIDITRKNMNIRALIDLIQAAIIELLAIYNISGHLKADAPGVYVDNAKICSLGLRVRHGCTYHGLSLNVDMDLEPFTRINPCGFADLQMTQIKHYAPIVNIQDVTDNLLPILKRKLGYI